MSWTYYQSTGALEFGGQFVAKGYSGATGYKNDPASEDKESLGPIPRGRYCIDEPRYSSKTGPYVLPLSPTGHNAHGRKHFQIHGDSRNAPGTASSGCIILPRKIREKVWSSGSKTIEVRR